MQQVGDLLEARVQQAMTVQDQKVENMMAQVMMHIEDRFKYVPQQGMAEVLNGTIPEVPMDP